MLLGSFVEAYDLIDNDEPDAMSPIAELDAGPLTETPYQQPTGYFPTSSNAEVGLFQMPTGSSMGPQLRRNTLTMGMQREPSAQPSRYSYQQR